MVLLTGKQKWVSCLEEMEAERIFANQKEEDTVDIELFQGM